MIEKLEKDLIAAMKAKDTVKLQVVREIKSNIKLANIDQKKEINDDLLVEVVSKAIKTRRESIESFIKGNRQDLVDKTENELRILEEYMPEQLSFEEVTSIIDEVFASVKPTSIKDMGKIMGLVTSKVKGKADMGAVSALIKSKLN